MSISEANYDNIDRTLIKGYRIETNDLGIGYDTSRQLLLIQDTIDYTRQYDYVDKYIAAIVVNIKLAKRNNLTIVAHYRK